MKELQKQVVNATLKGEMDLVNKRELRDRLVGNEAVFNDERVKALGAFLLPKDFGATTEQVANYFEVDAETIQKVIQRNKEELKANGLSKVTGEQLADIKSICQIQSRAKELTIFTRRAILNTAMLLRDSTVAKTIRSVLLDATENKTVVKEIVKQQDSYMIEDPIERAKAWIREQEESLEETVNDVFGRIQISFKEPKRE